MLNQNLKTTRNGDNLNSNNAHDSLFALFEDPAVDDRNSSSNFPCPLLDDKLRVRPDQAFGFDIASKSSNNVLSINSKYQFSTHSLTNEANLDYQTLSAMDINADDCDDISIESDVISFGSTCSLLSLNSSHAEQLNSANIMEKDTSARITSIGQFVKNSDSEEYTIDLELSQISHNFFSNKLEANQIGDGDDQNYEICQSNTKDSYQNTFKKRGVDITLQCDLIDSCDAQTSVYCDKIDQYDSESKTDKKLSSFNVFIGLERLLTNSILNKQLVKTFNTEGNQKPAHGIKNGELKSCLCLDFKIGAKSQIASLYFSKFNANLFVSVEREKVLDAKNANKITLWDLTIPQLPLAQISLPYEINCLDFSAKHVERFSIGSTCGKLDTFCIVPHRSDNDSQQQSNEYSNHYLYNITNVGSISFPRNPIQSLNYVNAKQVNGPDKKVIQICLKNGKIMIIDKEESNQVYEILGISLASEKAMHMRPAGRSKKHSKPTTSSDQSNKLMHLDLLEDYAASDSATLSRFSSLSSMAICGEDDSLYLVGSRSGFVFLCNSNWIESPIDYRYAHCNPVIGCDFRPGCSKQFATFSLNQVNYWNLELAISSPTHTYDSIDCDVKQICWMRQTNQNNNNNFLAVLTEKNFAIFDINIKSKDPILKIDAYKSRFECMAINYHLPLVLIGNRDKKVSLFRIQM